MWQRARTTSKAGFDRIWSFADKLGAPVNKLSNKLGSEAFWPTTLDKECEKAARILRSFCKDGFYEEDPAMQGASNGEAQEGPDKKRYSKILKKIPFEVIRDAKGIAIFTTMRTGLWISGAGGSGVLVARLPNGTWSPPSGILLHTAGVGFLVGVDIYDCIMVLNTDEAVSAFCKVRCTLGGEISAVAGPVGVGGVLESEVHKRQAPIFTYLKSRGFYAGVQLDGTIIIERSDENARFYGRKTPVDEILAGKVSNAPLETQRLIQTLKMAAGDTDVDPSMLPTEAPPSDFDVASGQVFGVPGREDPDPYGFLALEKEGLVVREAGTRKLASRESFQFTPSPSSPLFNAFSLNALKDLGNEGSRRSSWRTSVTEKSNHTVDMATQTELDPPGSPSRPQSPTYRASMSGIPEGESIDLKIGSRAQADSTTAATNAEAVNSAEQGVQTEKPELGTHEFLENKSTKAEEEAPKLSILPKDTGEFKDAAESQTSTPREPKSSKSLVISDKLDSTTKSSKDTPIINADVDADADDEDSEDDDDEFVEFHEIVQASAPTLVTASPQVVTKARLVTVTKPAPPALPSRNPNRSRTPKAQNSSEPLVGSAHDTLLFDEVRPVSRGSSVYSLPKEDVPSSAKGSESLGSISSTDHGDPFRTPVNEPQTVRPHPVDAVRPHQNGNIDSLPTLAVGTKTDAQGENH